MYVDNVAPVIVAFTEINDIVPSNQSVEITLNATDETALGVATLHYRV